MAEEIREIVPAEYLVARTRSSSGLVTLPPQRCEAFPSDRSLPPTDAVLAY